MTNRGNLKPVFGENVPPLDYLLLRRCARIKIII